MGELGDFQQGVGEASGSVGLVFSYIFAVVFVLMAIGGVYLAFVPTTSGSGVVCTHDNDCTSPDENCQNGKCFNKNKTKKPWMLIFSVLFLLMAIGIVWYSTWYNKWVHKSRRNAQIGGALTEFNMLADMLHH